MLARVRKWFDGAGWYVGGAVVLLVFALLAVLAGLQSPDSMKLRVSPGWLVPVLNNRKYSANIRMDNA